MRALALLAAVLLSAAPVWGQQAAFPAFDDKITYDIYFSNAENIAIIRSVEILGYKEIAGELFLTIQPNGFSLKDHEGYIRFDAIQAIIPDRNFQVEYKVSQ